MDEIKLKSCPFCGVTEVSIDHECVNDEMSLVWVSCLGCTAQGPLAYNEESAVQLWNWRVQCQSKD